MTPQQATEIGRRIVNLFRPSPPLREWTDVLERRDFDTCLRAVNELRERTAALDIPTYVAMYDQLRPTADGVKPRRKGEPSENCEHCRGSGWEDGPPLEQTVNGERHTYPTVVPCRCTIEAR